MLLEAFAIFVMLAILSILIIVHEVGHFSVARMFGFQTPVFGFGLPFGPYWKVGHKWGTEFRIHACLLGGYVAIPELGDETNAREENYGVPLQPFRKFPIWQRALVAFAGVGFNILFAYLVMFYMYAAMGQPTQTVVVEGLPKANPIAANAGVKIGDRILGIDDTPVRASEDIVNYLNKRPNTAVVLHLERPPANAAPKTEEDDKTLPPGTKMDINVTTNASGKVGMALVPRGPVSYTPVKGGIVDMAVMSGERLWKLTSSMLDALGMMFQGIANNISHIGQPAPPSSGGQSVGVGDLHGVLAVVVIGGEIAKQDWSQLFLFTIMISLDLAIINLVPWPALDGGHLAFMAYEAVRGRPLGERAHGEIVKWGFISLLVLMFVIMVNDVRALLTGELDFKKKKSEAQQQEQQDQKQVGKPTDITMPENAPAPGSTPAAGATDSTAPGSTHPAPATGITVPTPTATPGPTDPVPGKPPAPDAPTPEAAPGSAPDPNAASKQGE